MCERFYGRRTSPKNFVQFARAVWEMLQNSGRIVGASCTFRGYLALSEGTSLGYNEIGSCIFREISYGGSWGGMRSPHKISGRSEVVWWVNGRYEKTKKVVKLPAEFPNGMAVDGVL